MNWVVEHGASPIGKGVLCSEVLLRESRVGKSRAKEREGGGALEIHAAACRESWLVVEVFDRREDDGYARPPVDQATKKCPAVIRETAAVMDEAMSAKALVKGLDSEIMPQEFAASDDLRMRCLCGV